MESFKTFGAFQNIHGKKNIHSEYFVFPVRKEKKFMWVYAGGEDGLGNGVSDGGVRTWVVGVGGGWVSDLVDFEILIILLVLKC